MSEHLNPAAVRTALNRIAAGEDGDEALAVVMAAAEIYAAGALEWGFESPQVGMMFTSTNDMLVDVMAAARPDAVVFARIGLPWQRERG